MSLATRAALVPALALMIALIQLTVTHTSTLTPWKVGGFGMYSELHPNKRQLWLISERHPSQLITPSALEQKSTSSCAASHHQRCLRWPSPKCLCQLRTCLEGAGSSALVAYEPKFHVQHRQLERVELARCPALKAQTP